MLTPGATYDDVYRNFEWRLPARYNIAAEVSDRHARERPDATALIYEDGGDQARRYSFLEMHRLANKAANVFEAFGLSRTDRLAILLGQAPETAIAHLACWKLGAVSIPLFTLFEADALEYRLSNAGAQVLITNAENYAKVAPLRDRLEGLRTVFLIDGTAADAKDFWAEMEKASEQFETAATGPDDPALLCYTSGTTGPPKGALHGHRVLPGHLPGFDLLHEFFGQEGDLSWSPADWAWIAGLMDVLIPTWAHGLPVLAYRAAGGFDPEAAFHMMARHGVRNALMVPTMLKLMRQLAHPPRVSLRTMLVGGEAVGPEILEWGRKQFGVTLNEGYGQTECNLVLAHVPALMAAKPGALGQPTPGHIGAIVDDAGNEVAAATEGNIAFKRPDPVMMLEYWDDSDATVDKYRDDWLITGDRGIRDEDGYFWFVGRTDDVITSSGYRIGPGEIEDCLLKHPDIAVAAAIGVPDPVRTEVVKVLVVPAEGVVPGLKLEQDIRRFVRERLARHEYPRLIEFVDALPTTASGKIMRRLLREREAQAG